jgi:hypothetical protein
MAEQMADSNPAGFRRISADKLSLARRFLELTAEQKAVIAALPSEEAFIRIDSLVNERQQCIDEFDRLNGLAADLDVGNYEAADEQYREVLDELIGVLREAAELDSANKEALLAQREAMLKLIEQLKQGKQALEAYGRHEDSEAAFVDKNK